MAVAEVSGGRLLQMGSVRISENRAKCVPCFMPGISNRNRPRGGGPVSMRTMPVNTSCSRRYQSFGQQMWSLPGLNVELCVESLRSPRSGVML